MCKCKVATAIAWVSVVLALTAQPVLAGNDAANNAELVGTGKTTYQFSLPAQPLNQALNTFAQQADLRIVFDTSVAEGVTAPALSGNLTAQKALEILLASSNLTYRFMDARTVAIDAPSKPAAQTPRLGMVRLAQTEAHSTGEEKSDSSKSNADASDAEDGSAKLKLEEIIVTATKTASRLQDTAMSITALGSQDIERKNLQTMNDYLRTIPGVNMIDMGPGRNAIIMRGIAVDPQFESKAVGAYFGEIPVAGLSRRANDGGSSDFMMVDIARVEVLRGPQGTLYGSGSMGGTVRVIPNSANLRAMEGSLQAGYSSTARGGGPSNHVEGFFNIPVIEDKLAFRAVAYRFDTSGFIDNVVETSKAQAILDTGAIGRNEGDIGANITKGFRGDLLWKVTDALDVELLHASQDSSVSGRPDVDLTLGAYEQDRFVTPFGDENIEDDISASNALIRYDFGWSSLTSSSSWTRATGSSNRNFGGGFWEVTPVSQRNLSEVDAFTQELRLASQLGGRFQFVAGVYFEDMKIDTFADNRWGGSAALQAASGFGTGQELGAFRVPENIEQRAVFGELTYDITRQLSVTGGVRVFEYDRTWDASTITPGFFTGGTYLEFDHLESDEKEDSYKFNVSYKPGQDQLIYAQWSQGFRLGYPLSLPAAGSGCDVNGDGIHDDLGLAFRTQIDSDFLENTEVGAKLSALDRRLTINMAAYRIKWQGLPVVVGVGSSCGGGITLNAGSARSKGLELESSFYATENLRVDFGASFTNAELGVDVLGLAEKGDRLPGMPEHSFNLGLQYEFVVATRKAYVRSDAAYVGGFYGNLQGLGSQAGDYYQVNMKSGVNLGAVDVSVFVNNLGNSKALIWVDTFDPTAYRMRPRTFGLNLIYDF